MRGSARREARLDPVRWRRPDRSALLRSAIVAALVATAAVVLWARPAACEPWRADCGPESGAPRHGPQPSDRDQPPAAARAEARSGPPGSPAGPPGSALGQPGSAAAQPGVAAGQPGPTAGPPGSAAGSPASLGGRPGSLAVPSGSVGVPVRLAEPTALLLIHPGDHVDVLRPADPGRSPLVIATAALVLDVTGADDPAAGGLLLALTPAEARRTVTSSSSGYAVLIRPDG